MSHGHLPYEQLPARARRRLALASLLRSVAVSVAIVVGYFVLPMTKLQAAEAGVLVAGIAVVALLLAWQIREITRSPYPRIRAAGALATSVPLFLIIFATSYYLMGQSQGGQFTEPLSRLDSLYFTVTVFATVGFGDIAPVSQAARIVAILQMIGDLAIIGLAARSLFNAVQTGLEHKGE